VNAVSAALMAITAKSSSTGIEIKMWPKDHEHRAHVLGAYERQEFLGRGDNFDEG
jgi:hypothetical protein